MLAGGTESGLPAIPGAGAHLGCTLQMGPVLGRLRVSSSAETGRDGWDEGFGEAG